MSDPLPVSLLAASPLWEGLDGGMFVVACSGGRDSVALARAAAGLLADRAFCERFDNPPRLHLWHMDHGLREDSGADAEFASALAEQLHCGSTIHRARLGEMLDSEGGNAEELARRERYAALLDWLSGPEAAPPVVVATAHHLGDQAETVLFHLVRGTHLAGLRGIAPLRDGVIHRPWLALDPAELDTYLSELGQACCTDPTNADLGLARNKIRHEVLPRLTEINPRAKEHIARLSDTARAALAHVEGQLADLPVEVYGTGTVGSWLPLLGWPAGDYTAYRLADGWDNADLLALYAAQRLKERVGTLSRDEHDAVAHWTTVAPEVLAIRGQQLALPCPTVLTIAEQQQRLHPTPDVQLEPGKAATAGGLRAGLQATTAEAWRRHSLGQHQPWEFIRSWPRVLRELAETPPLRLGWRCYLAAGVRLPLTLRCWRDGDRITLSDGATKKLGDAFTDARIPKCFRVVWAVLTDAAGEVLWVPGLADSHWMQIAEHAPPAFQVSLAATAAT